MTGSLEIVSKIVKVNVDKEEVNSVDLSR